MKLLKKSSCFYTQLYKADNNTHKCGGGEMGWVAVHPPVPIIYGPDVSVTFLL